MIGDTHTGRRCGAIGLKTNDHSTRALLLATAQRGNVERNTNSPCPTGERLVAYIRPSSNSIASTQVVAGGNDATGTPRLVAISCKRT